MMSEWVLYSSFIAGIVITYEPTDDLRVARRRNHC
jgi:hypothetical protein